MQSIPYNFSPGIVLPFPGRVLRPGMSGDDIRALQEYLNYISDTYTEIPKITADGIFGPGTERAVNAFKELFNIPGTPSRVTAILWSAITNVYDDLYNGTAAVFAEKGNIGNEMLYQQITLPHDVGDYSRDVLYLKALISELSHFYPDSNGFEANMMYTPLFGEEIKRIRKIFGMGEESVFDNTLLDRILFEIKIRKKS